MGEYIYVYSLGEASWKVHPINYINHAKPVLFKNGIHSHRKFRVSDIHDKVLNYFYFINEVFDFTYPLKHILKSTLKQVARVLTLVYHKCQILSKKFRYLHHSELCQSKYFANVVLNKNFII